MSACVRCRVLDREPCPAERPLAVAKLSGWLVWAVSRLAVLVPGDRNAQVRNAFNRRGKEPGTRRVPIPRYGSFRQPGSQEDEFDRGDQDVIRRRYRRGPSWAGSWIFNRRHGLSSTEADVGRTARQPGVGTDTGLTAAGHLAPGPFLCELDEARGPIGSQLALRDGIE